MNDAELRLKAALETDQFALVGAGQLGEMALDLWPKTIARPSFVLDSQKRGTLRGIEIRDLKCHRPLPGITYLLSAFKMPVSDAKSIWASLAHPTLLTVYDVFEQHCPHILSNGWRKLDPSAEDLDRIARTRRCYVESRSRSVFDTVAAWRYRRELVDEYVVTPEADKYNLALFGRAGFTYDYVYDCGSYDLSLPSSLAKASVGFDTLVAFEPDPRRYSVCHENVEAWRREGRPGRIELESFAVCDEDARESFIASGLFSARLTSLDAPSVDRISVKTCTLDTYHEMHYGWGTDLRDADSPRVLIKAHVEGAEPRVLQGARKILERTRSDVLINLSHDEESFLDIPCFLESIGRFDLFFRSSSLFGEGLTLLAKRRS